MNQYEVAGAGFIVQVKAASVKTALTRGVQSIDRARKTAAGKVGLDATIRGLHSRKFVFSVDLLAEDV